jgi:hypothetical protein
MMLLTDRGPAELHRHPTLNLAVSIRGGFPTDRQRTSYEPVSETEGTYPLFGPV